MIRRFLVIALLVGATASPTLAAQKLKARPDLSGLTLWSAKGQPLARRQFVPGLNASLLLSDEQVIEVFAAWRETVDSPEMLEKGRALKLDPNTTDEQRAEFRRQHEAAQGRLQSRLASIFTPAQKDLMLSIEVLYGQAREAVQNELAPDFALAKTNADPAAYERVTRRFEERLATDFIQRLNLILTPAQRAAMESEAAEERRREAEAAAAKKG